VIVAVDEQLDSCRCGRVAGGSSAVLEQATELCRSKTLIVPEGETCRAEVKYASAGHATNVSNKQTNETCAGVK
jgi:hypothetical protein